MLNDFSGSPLVLSQNIDNLKDKGYKIDLYTGNKTKGFLSNISGISRFFFRYKRFNNKFLTLISLFFSQLILFLKLLKYIRKDCVIYINTLLPFGAALAGKLMRKQVVYHIHETSITPNIFKNFLKTIVRITANKTIYVSDYLKNKEGVKNTKQYKVYNALSNDFLDEAKKNTPSLEKGFNVLMLCSLKDYKGVKEFLKLSEMLPELNFELVLNTSKNELKEYFSTYQIPSNLTLYPAQSNVHLFYKKANIVLNLSHPEKWVETFGMTALEAMAYGLPVIVPPVGGIAEIVDNEKNGYKIDVRNLNKIAEKINLISSNNKIYNLLSKTAREYSKKYSIEKMILEIETILNN